MSFWTAAEKEALDHVVLVTSTAGRELRLTSPGCAELLAPDGTPLEWLVQQGLGLSGAVSRFRGVGLAKFQLVLTMSSSGDRAAYEIWEPHVRAPALGQPARIYRIEHPVLAKLRIDQCKFENEPGLATDKATGLVTLTYKCEAHRKPLPMLSAPTSAGSDSADGKAKSDFRARVEARIAANSTEIDRLGKELSQ